MQKQEKLMKYTAKYMANGYTKEEAEKKAREIIPYKQEDYLSIEDLKIKFDYPDMDGDYPDWITPEEHMKICFKTTKEVYDKYKYGWFCTPQEMATHFYIWSRIRLNRYNSYQHLKTGLVNRSKNMLREAIKKETPKLNQKDNDSAEALYERMNGPRYVWGSLDNTIKSNNEDESGMTYGEIIAKIDEQTEVEREMKDRILSVPNKQIRDLLIVNGYLAAGMDSLEEEYLNLLQNATPELQDNLLNISDIMFKKEEITNFKQSGEVVKKEKKYTADGKVKKEKTNVSFKDIVKAFGCNYFDNLLPNTKRVSLKTATEEIQEYIRLQLFDGIHIG